MTKKEYRNLFYDGFNSKLIETAFFESILEIPKLNPHKYIDIPTGAIPFSKRRYQNDPGQMLVFYEKDPEFRDYVSVPQKYVEELAHFKFVSSPDCCLCRDMPLIFQLANIAVSRSLGYYHQEQGKYVIPNVRWGDERTYTDLMFEIPPAFAGIPKHDIVTIGSYGCCQSKEDKYYLTHGLDAMLEYLVPEAVIVYGPYNSKLFSPYERRTVFYHIPDWITQKKGCE